MTLTMLTTDNDGNQTVILETTKVIGRKEVFQQIKNELRNAGQVVGLAAIATLIVMPFLVGILTENRDQRQLAGSFAAITAQASTAQNTPDLSPLPSQAFPLGTGIALLEIPQLGIRQIVVEGSSAEFTRQGPGHVPGTSGLGQVGNAAIVARRSAYGAPFLNLGKLKNGAEISVTTIQGKQTYVVNRHLEAPVGGPLAATKDNRLTLITSRPPIAALGLVTITAELKGKPFISYPQNPSWMAVHPLGVSGNPFPVLFLALVSSFLVYFGINVLRRYFSTVVVFALATPVVIVAAVVISRALIDLLPPSL